MEIVLSSTKSKYLEICSLFDLDNIQEFFKQFNSMKEPMEANCLKVSWILSKSNKEQISIYLLLVLIKTISMELNLGIIFY